MGYLTAEPFLTTLKDFQAGNSFQSLKKQAAKNPGDLKILFPLGKKWRERGENGKAAELLKKVAASDPSGKAEDAILAKRELAMITLEEDNDSEELAAFAKQYPDPKFALPAHRVLASVHVQENSLDLAEASYEYVQANDKADAEWMNDYAWFLATNGRKLDRALELASKAVEMSPKEPPILDTLAECYFRTKQFDKAAETQKKAVDLIEDAKQRKQYEARLRKFEEAAAKAKG